MPWRDGGGRVIEKYYTVEEVAGLLKVDPRTIRTAIHADKLKAARVGRHFRISESALQEYLNL